MLTSKLLEISTLTTSLLLILSAVIRAIRLLGFMTLITLLFSNKNRYEFIKYETIFYSSLSDVTFEVIFEEDTEYSSSLIALVL